MIIKRQACHGKVSPYRFFMMTETGAFSSGLRNTYAHPCHKKNYDITKGLSTKVNPPITGNTFSLREGSNLLVLRRMPIVSVAWTRLIDRLRIVSPSSEFKEKTSDNFSTMSLKWQRRTLSVARVTLSNAPAHINARVEAGVLDWDIEYGKSEIQDTYGAVVLWAFSVDAEIETSPIIKPADMQRRRSGKENYAFNLDWEAGRFRWLMKIDPVADTPFARA